MTRKFAALERYPALCTALIASPKAREAGLLRRAVWVQRSNKGIAKMIDSGSGWAKKLLVDGIERGQSRQMALRHTAMDTIDKIAKDTGAFKSMDNARERTSGIRGLASTEKIDVALGDYKRITKGQAMFVLAMDADARGRLDAGSQGVFSKDPGSAAFVLDDAKRREIASKLSPAEREFVRRVKSEVLDGVLRQPMFDAIRRMRGFEPEEVSGYFPIRVAAKLDDFGEPPALFANLGSGMTTFLENSGITRARQGGGKYLMIGDFLDTVLGHADTASRIAHLAEPVWDVRKTILQGEVSKEVRNRYGGSVLKHIEKSMELVGNGTLTRPDAGRFQRGLRAINGLRSRALTSFNHKSWAKQAWGGTSMLMAVMHPADVVRALPHGLSGKSLERLMELSPWFRERYGEAGHTVISGIPDPDAKAPVRDAIMAAARDAKELKGADFLRNVGRTADGVSRSQWSDAIPARIAFEAAKNEAKRLFPSLSEGAREKWAAKRAESVFRDTNNVYGATDSSRLAMAAREDAVVQAFNAFQGDQSKKFMMLDDAITDRDWKRAARVASVIAMSNAGSAAIQGGILYAEIAIGAAIMGNTAGDEWRRQRAIDTASGQFIRDSLGIQFGLDRFYGTVASAFGGGREGGGPMDMPTASAVTKMARGVTAMGAALHDMYDEEPGPKQEKAIARFHRAMEDAIVGGAGLTGNVAEAPYYSVKHVYQGATRSFTDDLRDARTELRGIKDAKRTSAQSDRLAAIEDFFSSVYEPLVKDRNDLLADGQLGEAAKVAREMESAAKEWAEELRVPSRTKQARK